jgi:hypothetical protein
MRIRELRFYAWLLLIASCSPAAFAQFTGSVQGVVQDPSGRAVPSATVRIVDQNTQVAQATTCDASGNYRFVNLPPDPYKVTVEANGFAKAEADITLQTEQNLNLPITLKVGAVSENVVVTTQAPIIDTADSRNQMTLENEAVGELPIPGRNMVTLTTLAPGVSGLGTVGGGEPGSAGTPGSAADNYSTETQVDASANGQGQMSNMYVVDGLDVTSGIRQGVLNLTPNPESIQEASVQVNTYSAQYSRATGVEEVMTTRSGSDRFHGSAADWYDTEQMFATTHFSGPKYLPFHGNNMSGAIGGPIIPHHQLYGFFAIEPLRSASATSGSVTFPDPTFVSYAQSGSGPATTANTVGTGIMSTYVPQHLSNVTVSQTAQTYFGNVSATNTTPICQADPAEVDDIPCSQAMEDAGTFDATSFRNGTQWFVRVDKNWAKDRIYGSIYRTTLSYGTPGSIPAFNGANNNYERAFQFNYAHTFSTTWVNEGIFGASRVQGLEGLGAPNYSVPDVSVTGMSLGYGTGFAQGDFIQNNYHWRDVLSHVKGAHTLKFGYEGWYGNDVEPFQGPWSQPTFGFNNLLDLAESTPESENHVYYNPTSGQAQLWSWDAASRTWGVFAEDTWKAKKNLTLTLGLRWDDSGNPWSDSSSTVFGNFYLGTGSTFQEQVASGYTKATPKALEGAVTDLWSPRIGFAWDLTGKGNTMLRGGFGIYNDWLTQANVQEEFRGSPPGEIEPSFAASVLDPTPGKPSPYFNLGSGDKPPFGFNTSGDYPALEANGVPCGTASGGSGCLNAQGGVLGANAAIGGVNPHLESPKANIWSATFQQKLGNNYSASVGYAGSHGYDMVGGGDTAGIVSYGQSINAFALDLYTNQTMTPTRLNHSFGSITYTTNDRYSNYESVFFDFNGRFARGGFIDASYTRSQSQDDASNYPAESTPSTYYGPSPWDVPNRFSLTLNYELKGLNGGHGLVGRITGGWGASGTTIFQSGYPQFVSNQAGFVALCPNGTATPYNSSENPTLCPSAAYPMTNQFGPGSGDYNVDGETANTLASVVTGGLDYPNVTNYQQGNSKSDFLKGVFTSGQFTTPTFGTEGNEKAMQFRAPNYEDSDLNIYKNTAIREGINFQVRFEFFDVFNRVNLTDFDSNLADITSTFGQARSQQPARNWQLGGRFSF